MTLKLCLACLLSFVEQASWAELVRQGGLSDQKIKKGTFAWVEKLSFWQSSVKIRDVAGTPTLCTKYVKSFCKNFLKRLFYLEWVLIIEKTFTGTSSLSFGIYDTFVVKQRTNCKSLEGTSLFHSKSFFSIDLYDALLSLFFAVLSFHNNKSWWVVVLWERNFQFLVPSFFAELKYLFPKVQLLKLIPFRMLTKIL